ncbi:unnamed protein product [Acanthoscelides obtectus]|uniref:Uncharacterized protein n=1 Tax=Acanthoscelides obtectus TaxID=200917 RepID=A0A9P0M5C7_ACAOB|nr:unnamed protein product [Acanthoscelides obtectus]CAK1626049.1 hypothetical protein AOBTE_LOCUS3563 [Acanthoscelides obtectus]
MGNLQTGEAKVGKSKGKTKGKRGKKGGKYDDDFTGVVPEEMEAGIGTTTTLKRPAPQPLKPSQQIIVTDSWCEVNQASAGVQKGDIKKEATPPSSSDSNFTDPQTPMGFDQSEESIHLDVEVPSTITESFLHDLTLNSFKLNEYRNRLEEEKTKKLSKLGVSKTSQISLDSTCPSDSFVTDNVEVVNETLLREIGLEYSALEREDTLKRIGYSQELDQDEDARSVKDTVKRMSNVGPSNGKQLVRVFF